MTAERLSLSIPRLCVWKKEAESGAAAGWKDGVNRLEAMNYIWSQSVLRAARAHSSFKFLTQLCTHTNTEGTRITQAQKTEGQLLTY